MEAINAINAEIINYLIRNRVSTTEVADCLGKKGAIEGVMPVNRGKYAVGNVRWVYTYNESNWPLHEQIQDMDENSIVLFESFNCGMRALFGELVSKYLLLYRQCKALVVLGNVRDAAGLIRQDYSIWCKGFNPVGCCNEKPTDEFDKQLIESHREKYDGAIAVCDDCGVVIIPKSFVSEDFLQKLMVIENQEDIWFDRLDHYKENTYEIVCQKKYLNDKKSN